MKSSLFVMTMMLTIVLGSFLGCASMERGASKTGSYAGKAARVGDKVSEGAADAYVGEEAPDNPYNR